MSSLGAAGDEASPQFLQRIFAEFTVSEIQRPFAEFALSGK